MKLFQNKMLLNRFPYPVKLLIENILNLNIREINYFWWRLNLKYVDELSIAEKINENNYIIESDDIYFKAIDKIDRLIVAEGYQNIEQFVNQFMLRKNSYLIPNEHLNWLLNNFRSALWFGQQIVAFKKDFEFRAVGKDDYMNQLKKLLDIHVLWLWDDSRILERLDDIREQPNYQIQLNRLKQYKYKWFNYHISISQMRWLDIKNTAQLDDAIDYLAANNRLILKDYFIATNNQEKMALILASLDNCDFFPIDPPQPLAEAYSPKWGSPSSKSEESQADNNCVESQQEEGKKNNLSDVRKEFIAKFRKKYAMQSYRKQQSQSKEKNTVKLSQGYYLQLEDLAKSQGLTPRKMIEKLLHDVVDNQILLPKPEKLATIKELEVQMDGENNENESNISEKDENLCSKENVEPTIDKYQGYKNALKPHMKENRKIKN